MNTEKKKILFKTNFCSEHYADNHNTCIFDCKKGRTDKFAHTSVR